MIPESRLIRSEITIRELSLPEEVLIAKKSLIRWIALSLGMIMPNESRRLLLDILEVLLEFHVKEDTPTTKDVISALERQTKSEANPKAVYYHLQRLQEAGVITRKKGRYQIGDGEQRSLKGIFRGLYSRKSEAAFSNIDKALDKLEHSYR